MNIIVDNFFQTLCFIIGAICVFVGFGLAVVVGEVSDKWQARGWAMFGAGMGISMPAMIPISITIVGGDINSTIYPDWLLSIVYISCPLVGVFCGWRGWRDAEKRFPIALDNN